MNLEGVGAYLRGGLIRGNTVVRDVKRCNEITRGRDYNSLSL